MPEIGQTLSHFRIVSKIGQGGMGEVYLADDTTLDRKVALKFLPEAFTSDPERMARFEREAKLLASLNHPNIAGIHGLEQADGTRFLVLEYVEGETLQARLSKGSLPLEDALALCRQIAEGLEAAHEKGVIHRDLKPANVMITAEEKVKILDFGLAKAFSDETQSIDSSQSPTLTEAMTQPGVILGTAAYMSPEQAKGKSVDKRADIWAFGCILYECLTGKKAFVGETVTETLAAVIKEDPDLEKAPAKARLLLLRCLEKDPKRRVRDISEAMAWIERSPEFESAKRPLLPWGVAVAAVIVALVLTVMYFRGETPAPAEPMRLQILYPENYHPGFQGTFALSPNSRYLAFSVFDSETRKQSLWLRNLDSLESHPLRGTEDSYLTPFFWSPDSRSIAYDAGGQLKKVDISGESPPYSLCDLPGLAIGGSWNREGVIIFGDHGGTYGIVQVPDTGGDPFVVTRPDPERQEGKHFMPSFLSDGRHFIYFCDSAIPENRGIYVGSLDAKPEEQPRKQLINTSRAAVYVPGEESNVGYLFYMLDRTLMARPFDEKELDFSGGAVPIDDQVGYFHEFGFFSASETGHLIYRRGTGLISQPTWYDHQGNPLGTAGDKGTYFRLAISPDGTQVATSWVNPDQDSGNPDVYVRNLKRNTNRQITSGNSSRPVWSPDGTKIIFASDREGSNNLYRMLVSEVGEEELLLESSDNTYPTSWSHDGRFVLYTAVDNNSNSDLWVLSLEDKTEINILNQNQNNEEDGHFSPNMQWVAYVSDRDGMNEVYVQRFIHDSGNISLAGNVWKISEGGGSGPRWKNDGKELYYRTPDGQVAAVVVETDKTFQAGTPTFLFKGYPNFETHTNIAPFPVWDVHPDGSRFLLMVPYLESTPPPFNLFLNWTSLLKK